MELLLKLRDGYTLRWYLLATEHPHGLHVCLIYTLYNTIAAQLLVWTFSKTLSVNYKCHFYKVPLNLTKIAGIWVTNACKLWTSLAVDIFDHNIIIMHIIIESTV